MQVTPYNSEAGKKQQIEQMFNRIAFRYDLLNRILSLGIDKTWRKKAIRKLDEVNPDTILDVATGTGDLAIAAAKRFQGAKITGLDLSENMLVLGSEKAGKLNLNEQITFIKGDSENLPFAQNSFNAVTVSFGVRNFENLEKGIAELNRVLTERGKVVILEFSMPRSFPVKQLYSFYLKRIMPKMGSALSGDKKAYNYLHDSVKAFPSGEDFLNMMKNNGFKNTRQHPLMWGIASIYTGIK